MFLAVGGEIDDIETSGVIASPSRFLQIEDTEADDLWLTDQGVWQIPNKAEISPVGPRDVAPVFKGGGSEEALLNDQPLNGVTLLGGHDQNPGGRVGVEQSVRGPCNIGVGG